MSNYVRDLKPIYPNEVIWKQLIKPKGRGERQKLWPSSCGAINMIDLR